jgi:oligopeptide transport system substrate-binding protein
MTPSTRPLPATLLAATLLAGCGAPPWNNPYPDDDPRANTYYSSFAERLKHVDPARSYSSNEAPFLGAVYEPPLQYHYLKRPYTLEPLAAEAVPEPTLLDAEGRPLPADADPARVAYSVYAIRIRPGIRYQPHPAFARGGDGELLYHDLAPGALEGRATPYDFPELGSRELTAADYAYQIKRLAHPALHSPILGLMKGYIVGLDDLARRLEEAWEAARQGGPGEGGTWLDLRELPLAGVEVVDRYTYRVTLKGRYPQFLYWLAMHFFAPVPWEAEAFYAQPGMAEKNFSLDWYPVGTGPYVLTENNPNRRIVLERNPNYHGAAYPSEGEPGDAEAGLLDDAGAPLPFIDRYVYTLEREDIPRWNKFLQGYYDGSGIVSDAFDQAVSFNVQGEAGLTPEMREKGIRLTTAVSVTTFYTGFNMLDEVVGGYGERARKLRRAIAIAVDDEEFISIFMNGRGIPAQGPIPPGIFGHQEGEAGINPYVYRWVDGRAQRRPLAEARRLMAEAGYPEGRDARTGKPLLLYLDITASGPDDKARLDWWRKQFAKLGIQLVIRNTDYNRFRDKMREGNVQIFFWGWGADYPDPENFLFLLYGPNSKARNQGENATNYANPEYDRLFERVKDMRNGPQRAELIRRMLAIARRDGPWLWGFHRKDFTLYHQWVGNAQPNLMANNTLRYLRLDPALRAERRVAWNQPVLWPLWTLLALLAAALLPALLAFWHRERRVPAVAVGEAGRS